VTDEVIFVESDGLVFVEGRSEVLFVDRENEAFALNLGEQGPPGASDALPGGTTGQLRAKASDADFDEAWIDPPESLPTGGTAGQILTKLSSTDGDADWEDPAPTGATPADIANVMAFAATNG
jgi:hypothetical protein